jgi:hypothetical protein
VRSASTGNRHYRRFLFKKLGSTHVVEFHGRKTQEGSCTQNSNRCDSILFKSNLAQGCSSRRQAEVMSFLIFLNPFSFQWCRLQVVAVRLFLVFFRLQHRFKIFPDQLLVTAESKTSYLVDCGKVVIKCPKMGLCCLLLAAVVRGKSLGSELLPTPVSGTE